MDDFSQLYLVSGVVETDNDRTSKYYFGLVDRGGKLSDTGVDKSIKGVYLMNYQGLTDNDVTRASNLNVATLYQNDNDVTCYVSLYQFDTQNHAWKVFMVDSSLKAVTE